MVVTQPSEIETQNENFFKSWGMSKNMGNDGITMKKTPVLSLLTAVASAPSMCIQTRERTEIKGRLARRLPTSVERFEISEIRTMSTLVIKNLRKICIVELLRQRPAKREGLNSG